MTLEFAAFDYDTRDPQSLADGKKFYREDGTPLTPEVAYAYKPDVKYIGEGDINGWLTLSSSYSAGQGQGASIREVAVADTPLIYPYMRDRLAPDMEYALVTVSTSKDTNSGFFIKRYIFSADGAITSELLEITDEEVAGLMTDWQLMGVQRASDYAHVEYPQPMRWLQTNTRLTVSHLFYQREQA